MSSFGNLFFVKTQNTGTGTVEIHSDSADSDYQKRIIATGTALQLKDRDNGSWQVDHGNLYFIRTNEPGTKTIEVHRVPPPYSNFDIQTGTAFNVSLAKLGHWIISDGDLYFIQTSGTDSKKIEIHYSSLSSGYKNIQTFRTNYPADQDWAGYWRVANKSHDVIFVSLTDRGFSKVQISILRSKTNYESSFEHFDTSFRFDDIKNGTWRIFNQDFYFIKTANVGNKDGRVEVHISTADKAYQDRFDFVSDFSVGDAYNDNGTWTIASA